MNAVDTTQTVQDLYVAFGRADVPAILALLAEDAELYHSGPADVLPWSMLYRGKAEWGRFFQDVGQAIEFTEFAPERFIAQGDTVVALGHFAGRARATGRPVASHWAMEWTFQDGDITHCRVHEDTAALAAAVSQ
ncbi:MAG: nuclear transport factor 2 family protein [Dehalococcoidia bacterium]